jgi:Holliday junction resolvase RusA-like endonuclease
MKTVYDIFVLGLPKAQPRPRLTKTGHVYTPGSANDWKETVIAEIMLHRKPVITVPVRLTVCFYFPVPKSVKQKDIYFPHAGKPDVDNLLKAVMDAMTQANVWKDDTQVYRSHAEKWYCREYYGARIKVEAKEKGEKEEVF